MSGVMLVNKAADDVSKLADTLRLGYFSYLTVLEIAKDPRSDALVPPVLPGQRVPIGRLGSATTFHFHYFLQRARTDPNTITELNRLWAAGALLTLADALQHYRYFDQAPILEMIYHLRNGIGHGNKFNFTPSGIKRLANYPAHNKSYAVGAKISTYEITPALNGQNVLFDYIQAEDIAHLLHAVYDYLNQMAYSHTTPQ